MPIRILFLLLVFVFLNCFPTTVSAQFPDFCNGKPCIQVGTFNIEWFGTTDPEMHPPRSEQTVARIAQLITDTLDLEVVVLEEINSQSQEYQWLQNALAQKGYRMRRVGTSGGEQGVVIAFDADEVTLLNDNGGNGIREMNVRSEFNLGGGCVSGGLRLPIVGKFRAGQFDFVLVGVHLKSQRGVDSAGANAERCSDEIRRAQARDIIAALPNILHALNDQDVIIAGDFNATLADPSLSPFFTNGFVSLSHATRRAQGSNTISYLKAPFQEIIDHVLIRPVSTTEWAARSTFIFRPPPIWLNDYLRFTSDHAPVWTSFRTN